MMTVSMSLLIIVVIFLLLSAGLAWYFLSHDRGSKEPIAALWIAAGFGLLATVLAAFVEIQVIPQKIFSQNSLVSTPGLFSYAMMIGFIEEIFKFIPLAVFIYKKPYFNEYSDGIIYFAIAGLGFGVPENILYTFSHGAKVGVLRIFLTPIFHAAMTAFVGYFLIAAKKRQKSIIVPSVALVFASVIHGIYDFGLLSAKRLPIFAILSLAITFYMSAFLFVLYKRATKKDQANGDSAVGNNSFCRHCGQKNINHNLYCSSCGQRA